jgi:hypothetical protein
MRILTMRGKNTLLCGLYLSLSAHMITDQWWCRDLTYGTRWPCPLPVSNYQFWAFSLPTSNLVYFWLSVCTFLYQTGLLNFWFPIPTFSIISLNFSSFQSPILASLPVLPTSFLGIRSYESLCIIPYSRKYWRELNFGGWAQNRYCKNISGFKFGGSVRDCLMYIYE